MTAPLQVNTKLSRRRDNLLAEIVGIDTDGKHYHVRGFYERFTAEQIDFYFHIISNDEYAADMAIKAMPKETK